MIRNPSGMMWRDMENMRAEPENMVQAVTSGNRLLPARGMGDRVHPAIRGEFPVDVRSMTITDCCYGSSAVEKESVTSS